jgi:hypothetical protein
MNLKPRLEAAAQARLWDATTCGQRNRPFISIKGLPQRLSLLRDQRDLLGDKGELRGKGELSGSRVMG